MQSLQQPNEEGEEMMVEVQDQGIAEVEVDPELVQATTADLSALQHQADLTQADLTQADLTHTSSMAQEVVQQTNILTQANIQDALNNVNLEHQLQQTLNQQVKWKC